MDCSIKNGTFTLFGKGYLNRNTGKAVPSTKPVQSVDIAWTGRYITSDCAKAQTLELRRMMVTATEQELRDYKLLKFDAVAGAGVFSYGNAKGLVERSPFIVLDIDDLSSTEEARQVQQTLIADKEVETALCFVSPKGLGVKWWAMVPEWCKAMDFATQYAVLSRYIGFNYGVLADASCSNVNRLCFLPWDNDCFINEKFI
ncbi:MAG: hypothetical protein J6W24_01935 [Prevotella sp.]|nr:hypothetical protein [Prevotella sp.]